MDEVLIALDAHSMASTGHDVRGESFPLYFPVGATSWYQPAIIYLTALVLKFVPLSESAIRAPTVALAVLDIVLIYFVARQLLASELFGIIAAVLLALTPAHYIHARYGMDYLYPVPFILGWLLCLIRYRERRRPWLLILSASILGIGFYSYIASIVTMPLYFLVTCLILYIDREDRRAVRLCGLRVRPLAHPVCRMARRASERLRRDRGEVRALRRASARCGAGVSVALELRERQRTRVDDTGTSSTRRSCCSAAASRCRFPPTSSASFCSRSRCCCRLESMSR